MIQTPATVEAPSSADVETVVAAPSPAHVEIPKAPDQPTQQLKEKPPVEAQSSVLEVPRAVDAEVLQTPVLPAQQLQEQAAAPPPVPPAQQPEVETNVEAPTPAANAAGADTAAQPGPRPTVNEASSAPHVRHAAAAGPFGKIPFIYRIAFGGCAAVLIVAIGAFLFISYFPKNAGPTQYVSGGDAAVGSIPGFKGSQMSGLAGGAVVHSESQAKTTPAPAPSPEQSAAPQVPTPEQVEASIDCPKASAWDEVAVCFSNVLSVMDRKVGALYRENLKAAQTQSARNELISSQRDWVGLRRACKVQSDPARCLQFLYTSRVALLNSSLAINKPRTRSPAPSAAVPQTPATQPAPTSSPLDRTISSVPGTHTFPPYPPSALRRGQQGTVRLYLTVSARGDVTEARLSESSGARELDQAAADWVVGHWKYYPAIQHGVAVASTTTIELVFKLGAGSPAAAPPVQTNATDRPVSSIARTHTLPPYPRAALQRGQQGTVRLNLAVTARGDVQNATVEDSSGVPELDQAAVSWVVARWKYSPAVQNGVEVSSTVAATLAFSLKDPR